MQYKVVSGDTLFKIAQKLYGNGNYYMAIAEANGISNPNYIQVGQILTIPGQEKYGPTMPGEAKMTPPASSTNLPATIPNTPVAPAQGSGGMDFMKIGLIVGVAVLGYFVFTKLMEQGSVEPQEEVTDV